MVRGSSTPGFIFDQNAEALRVAGLRVLQFDHPGRDWSGRPARRCDAGFCDWKLLALLDALVITEPVGFASLSMGGPIVAKFAVRHPERVARVFLFVAAGLHVAGAEGVQASLTRAPVIGSWLWRMVALKSVAKGPQYDESGFAPGDQLQGDVREQMKYRGYGRALISTFRYFAMRGREDTCAALAATGIPVAAVFGTKDLTVLIASADQVRGVMPEAVVHIL